jgi:hypothetical protein
MFGEYKLIAFIVAGVLLLGSGVTAVLSYNHYIKVSARQEEQIKGQQQQIENRDQVINDQIQRQSELKRYQRNAEQRSVASENRVKQILSMRSIRDEKGNIAPDDPVLGALNGMYPGQTAESPAGHTPGAAVPQKTVAPGPVASGKDVLPE